VQRHIHVPVQRIIHLQHDVQQLRYIESRPHLHPIVPTELQVLHRIIRECAVQNVHGGLQLHADNERDFLLPVHSILERSAMCEHVPEQDVLQPHT